MNQIEQNIKGKFYQSKTYSEKRIAGGGKEKLQLFQLLNLLEKGTTQNLQNFLEKEHPSPEILNQGIISLIKKYQKGEQKFYELLCILFAYGASPNISIIYDEINGNNSIKEADNVTLLMLGIKNNDLKLINIILNFNPEIDKPDKLGRNSIIYAIIFNNKDSTNIINLLIKHKANINYSLKLQMSEGQYEYQSVFTLAIHKDLKNITKCLLDNNVNVNFRTEPKGDTGLHIAAEYAKTQLVELLLSYKEILGFLEVKNNEGKIPIELIKENDTEKNEKINIFKNYYNFLHNLRINNQNMKMIYSEINNNNLKNYNPQLNKMQQQMNQQIQLNKMHEFNNNSNNINNNIYQKFEHYNTNNNQINMKKKNNGKLINMNNSPNSRYSYIPPEKNISMENQSLRNNNMNISNNFFDNKNINQNVNNNNFINNDLNQEHKNIIENNDNTIPNINNNINYNKNNNELEKIINKKNEKDINIFTNKNQQTPEKSQFLNQINPYNNNNKQNISYLNKNQLSQIKNKLNTKLLNKKNINYNIEIPIEFIKNNHNNYFNNSNINVYEINNFIKQNNIPILNLDLSNKSLLLELKLNDLEEKLKNLNIKYKDVIDKHKSIIECKEIQEKEKSKKEKDLEFGKIKINENNDIKNNLIKEQKELLNKIPHDKILQESNKNIADSEIRRLKFGPPQLEEKYIIKVLNKDLIDYEKYIDYKMLIKKPKIDLFLEKFKVIINETFPDFEIKIFGAYAQGLSLPWSDLKIVLINKNDSNNTVNINADNITDNETVTAAKTIKSNTEIDNNTLTEESSSIFSNYNNDVELLRNISYTLKKYNLQSQLIINEKDSRNYLFLSTNEEFDKIKIYISLYNHEHHGLKVLELVKNYMKEYPPLRPLILALGTILKRANLNKVNSGGLPFYGLILMIVSFIQSQKDNIINSFDLENINGKLFYDFLKFYGINFDFNKYMVITYLKNEINAPLTEKENQFNFCLNPNIKELTILDPLNKKNNVAKSTFQFMNLKMAFMIAFMVANEDCECGCHYGRSTFEHNYISTEHCYLKRIFNSVKRFNEPQ